MNEDIETPADKPDLVQEHFPSNAHKDKGAKKVERVTQGEVQKRKKHLFGRIREDFVTDDASSVGSYLIFEVLIPAAKTTITDMVSEGVERLLFGDSHSRKSSFRNRPTAYGDIYRRGPAPTDERTLSKRARATHDFDEIVIRTRGEAVEVLDRLQDLVLQYNVATVSDLYDLVGITGNFTEDRWGWYDMRGVDIRKVRDGYLLCLPRPQPVN